MAASSHRSQVERRKRYDHTRLLCIAWLLHKRKVNRVIAHASESELKEEMS